MACAQAAGKVALIIAAFLFFLLTIALNALAATGGVTELFQNVTGDISDAYYLEVTPAGWTFSVWGVIYLWQALWLIYGLSTICRMKDGQYLYTMSYMPAGIYVVFILNLCCNIAWLFLWDRQFIVASLFLIALTPFTLYCCLYLSFSRLYRNLGYLVKRGFRTDVWLVRLFVQNGMSFYATWVTVATLLNFGMVLTYKIGLDQGTTSTIILAVVAVEVVAWFVLDVILFDKYTRYNFSPYLMEIIAFSGVVSRNFDLDARFENSVFMLALLVVACVMATLKFIIMMYRHFNRPIDTLDYNMPTSLSNLKGSV